jgi:UDP-sulfoquinovose synthase
VENNKFLANGLNPKTLDEGLFDEIINIANKFKDRCDLEKIPCKSLWSRR